MRRWWCVPAALLLGLLVYLRTLCPTVYVEGSGELIGATHFLGTPHPTGYPLFCLIGRLFSALLPMGEAAYKINLASAFTGALAAAALTALLRLRQCQSWAALGAGLVFAFSATFWSQVVVAEVYGLSMLAATVSAGVGLRAAEERDPRWLLLLAFSMGVGLTTHLSHLLLWPGLVALLAWRWTGVWRRGALVGRSLLCLIGGYSLALYLPLRNGLGPGYHWGPLDSTGRLWEHLSGALYRPSFFAVPWEGVWLNARRWGGQVMGEFHPLLVPLVVWGLWVAWRRDRSVLLVAGGAILLNLASAWNYHRDPNGLGVFFLLSILGLAVFLGYALDDVGRRLPGRAGPLALAVVAVLLVLTGNLPRADRSQNWIAHRYGCDLLEDLPRDAVLMTQGDDAMFLLDYLQRVEGMRPDVSVYSRIGRGTDLLTEAERSLGPRERHAARSRREAGLIREGRPVFYLAPVGMPVPGHAFVPVGLCYRAWPEEQEAACPGGAIDLKNARETGFFRDPWVRKIQSNYWFMLGEREWHLGQRERALQAYTGAAAVAHDSRTVRHNVALAHYRDGQLDEAFKHAAAVVRLDPLQADTYRLMARIRQRQGRHGDADILLKRAQVFSRIP